MTVTVTTTEGLCPICARPPITGDMLGNVSHTCQRAWSPLECYRLGYERRETLLGTVDQALEAYSLVRGGSDDGGAAWGAIEDLRPLVHRLDNKDPNAT